MSAAWRRQLEDRLQDIWRTRGLISTLLTPFSRLYGHLSARRMARQAARAWRAPVPVIVIGNILVGGTGKTPVTAAVCQFLQAQGWRPGILSRGYGTRPGIAPRLSDQSSDSAYLGDEPALLHTLTGAPVGVHPQRPLAATALLQAHPDIDVLLADDGLQHVALARDIEIIVQDARGVGNGRLLPAGPLREPPDRRQTAGWLITQLGASDTPPPSLPVDATGRPRQISLRLQADHLIHLASGKRLDWSAWQQTHGRTPCSAAAGIGRPQRFFAMLRQAGLILDHTVSSPDHQAPSLDALNALSPAAPILITAKDAVKYAPPYDPRLWVVYAAPVFSDPDWCRDLEAMLHSRQATLSDKQRNRH